MRNKSWLSAALVAALSLCCRQPSDAATVAELAGLYAPAVMLAGDEPNRPANVDWFLSRTTISVVDLGCSPNTSGFGVPTQPLLSSLSYRSPCSGHTIQASGTRSKDRAHTFVLADVNDADKAGAANPLDWATYYHVIDNGAAGLAIQYWLFYAFNTGKIINGPFHTSIEVGYHGGDWEMVEVTLDRSMTPSLISATGHTNMDSHPWSAVQKMLDTYPIVFAERGGHEMHIGPLTAGPYIQDLTWPGSQVVLLDPSSSVAHGPLVDLGTRLHPKAAFLSYSGLWGSLGLTPFSSGYWGPAYNETGLGTDGFLAAWCYGMINLSLAEGARRECYPDDQD